jgi:hypothetical protein
MDERASSPAAYPEESLRGSVGEWMECVDCGDDVRIERWALGYRVCLFCGEDRATTDRASWCVIQEYGKGNYQYVTPTSAHTTLFNTNQKHTRGNL